MEQCKRNKEGRLYITIESIQELDSEYSGVCLYCNNVKYSEVEPDAENYECEVCGMDGVTGSHWLPMMASVKIVETKEEENIKW